MVLIMDLVMGIMTVFIKSTLAAGYSIMGGFINLNAGAHVIAGIIAAFIAVLISMYIYYLCDKKSL